MSSDNILVAIKSRPLISREKSEKLKSQWTVQEKVIFQVDEDGHRIGEPYSFDHIFTEQSTNASVYSAVVEPLIKSFLNGFNSTIFAYGQTSSGKTHTMIGTDSIPGIIQLAISDVFQHVSSNTQRRYLISCSYFEIYNEKINDLLDKNGQDLKIREDFCGNTFVNAKEELVTQQAQVVDLMKLGNKIRKIGCTNMNERSSRSHTIFRFTIKSTENNIEHGPVQISHLNLVDLAGSERIAHTKAAGVRLKEGVNINKSLLALGNVIRQLSEGEGYINYRDSNLTRLLQHALGGNAKSLIIATITVAAGEETKSTLEFAQRAKVVKNKPVINEILSEQVKLRQYELASACYKERLEKERQRIQEMELEKEEREREITKLKQQVKLIDLFTNGPEVKKAESKIPRRHTMGYYGSRIPLQTIPESRVLSSNIIQEKDAENISKCDEEDDELLFKTISRASDSDYDYLKMTIEECEDDGILAVTPEPQDEVQNIQQETTPTSHLRERLKHLEESYTSLKEFTKLEAECKEDKDVLHELIKEKENLLKDVIDLNAIIKDIRREKEDMKIKFEEEFNVLQNDLDFHKKKSSELAFTLEQAEAEKDVLRLAKEQLLNDEAFRFEQQRLKYEAQIKFYISEIELLNNENNKVDTNFEEEIQKLQKENENLKLNVEKITTYEQNIAKLQEKLEEYEKREEDHSDVLSVATQTEEVRGDIEKELMDITNETIIIQKECDELKENINVLTETLEKVQTENLELNEELRRNKLMGNTNTYLEIETYSRLERDITKKQEKVNSLLTIVANLENENERHLNTIDFQNEDIQLKSENILQLTNKLGDLQKHIQNNEETINALLEQIEQLELSSQNQNDTIVELKSKIEHFEKLNLNYVNEISNHKEQIEIKENTITDLTTKIENLEAKHKTELHELQCDAAKQQKVINDMKKELDIKTKSIRDQLMKFENESRNYEEEINIFKKEVICKEDEISIQQSIIDGLTAEQICNEANLISYRKEVATLKNKLEELEKDIGNYNEEVVILNEELISKKQKIATLVEKVSCLENDNERYMKEVPNTEHLVQQMEKLEEKNKVLEETNSNLKREIKGRDQVITKLNDIILHLEKCSTENKNGIKMKDNHISQLTNKIDELEICKNKLLEDVEIRDQKIIKLTNDISNLVKCNDGFNEQIEIAQQEIIELTKQIDKTVSNEEEIQIRESKISNLTTKIRNLEEIVSDNEHEIAVKNREISELKCAVKDLENSICVKIEEINVREKTISEFSKKIKYLERNVQSNEYEIKSKNDQIIQLAKKINELEATIQRNKEEVKTRNSQILELTNEITCLKDDKHRNEGKIIHLEEDIISKQATISELKQRVQRLDDECHSFEHELSQSTEEILLQERKIKELTERGGDQSILHKKVVDYEREDDVQSLSVRLAALTSDKTKLEQSMDDVSIKIENEKMKNRELEARIRNMYMENVALRSRIFDLENVITELRSGSLTRRMRTVPSRRSSTSSSTEVSPKEVRRRKRQSLHDQRRGIDLTASANDGNRAAANLSDDTSDEDLKAKMKRMKSTIDYLSQENDALEFEVQGCMEEVKDQKKYNAEKDKEIEFLTAQIEQLKQEMNRIDCIECPQNQEYIKKLEDLQKQNQFKIVELQTKYYDLQNKLKDNMKNWEEKERRLHYHITELQRKLGDIPQPEVKDAEIQCDDLNIQQLLEKYVKVKKLARMRRDEINALRERLGIDSDEPI